MPDYNRTISPASMLSTPSMTDITNGIQVNSGSPLQQIIFVIESGLLPFIAHWKDHVKPASEIKIHLDNLSTRVSKEIHEPLNELRQTRLGMGEHAVRLINESFYDISKQLFELDNPDHERYENINSFQDSYNSLAAKLY